MRTDAQMWRYCNLHVCYSASVYLCHFWSESIENASHCLCSATIENIKPILPNQLINGRKLSNQSRNGYFGRKWYQQFQKVTRIMRVNFKRTLWRRMDEMQIYMKCLFYPHHTLCASVLTYWSYWWCWWLFVCFSIRRPTERKQTTYVCVCVCTYAFGLE